MFAGSHYTWTKVVTTIHNIIIGNMWIDQVQYMYIVHVHTTCTLYMCAMLYMYTDLHINIIYMFLNER